MPLNTEKQAVEFRDLESLVCDSENMADVLMELIGNAFGETPPDGKCHMITGHESNRLYFAAVMSLSMARKAKEGWYQVAEAKR